MLSPARRTTVQTRDYICKGSDHHRYRGFARLQVTDAGQVSERLAEFRPLGTPSAVWSRLPICPSCSAIAEESATYDPATATVPSSERFVAWLSPDGQRLAVPGRSDATMPDRYRVSGYRPVEAHSVRDFDRLSDIRAAQTGNEIIPEVVCFDEESRRWHDEADYDPDDMTSMI